MCGARFACPELGSVAADSGFAAERVWRGLQRRGPGLVAYIPPQPTMLPAVEPTTDAQQQAVAARARCKSKGGIWAHKRRMADAEGVIGELKNRHGLDLHRPQLQTAHRPRPRGSQRHRCCPRVRSRGTPLFHIQLLLGSAAAARDLSAPAPASAATAAADMNASTPAARPNTWNYTVCLN